MIDIIVTDFRTASPLRSTGMIQVVETPLTV
jgi:hypothetical protein